MKFREMYDKVAVQVYDVLPGASYKARSEMAYWRERHAAEGTLSNDHYERYYTSFFGLDHAFYEGKRVLDVGCGPRGSLEWATMAAERVGLDPLADTYRELGTDKHAMTYACAPSEAIPFDDGYFDVVCTFNSLDHVDDLDRTIAELIRVVKPGGLLLLLSDLHDEPTACEPVTFMWDIVGKFAPPLEIVEERHFEKSEPGIYQSIDANIAYNHDDPTERYGIVAVKFSKP